MKAKTYALALYKTLAQTPSGDMDRLVDGVLARFVNIVRERGHTRLFSGIVQEFELLVSRQTGGDITVTVAHNTDLEKMRTAIEHDLATLGSHNTAAMQTRTHIDDSLIGGYIVEARGKRIDASYKRTLLNLYQNLVSA